jgi:hypothetical protein
LLKPKDESVESAKRLSFLKAISSSIQSGPTIKFHVGDDNATAYLNLTRTKRSITYTEQRTSRTIEESGKLLVGNSTA